MSRPSRPSDRWLGYLEAVGAASLWGSSGIFAVHLFRMGLPPESVALLRPVVGVLILVGVFAIWRRDGLRVDLAGALVIGLGGGLAVGVFQLSYQLSTDAVGVPTTVALLYLAPAIVVAASGPLLHEWPTWTRAALAALTLAGVWLSVLGAEAVPSVFGGSGVAWGVLAGVSYATYTLFGRYATRRWGSVATVVYSTAGACLVLVVTLPLTTGPIQLPESGAAWALLIAFGALTIALAQFLFFDALGRIEASRASLATASEPVVAAVLATLLLGQGLTGAGWIGIGLVVAGVIGVGVTASPTEADKPPAR